MKTIPKPTKYNKSLFFYAAAFIIFFWSLVVHPFEFPDEQSHMGSVEFLSRVGRMPVGEEMDMTKEMKFTQDYLGIYRNSQGHNKYTYHPEYHVDYTNSTEGKFEHDILSLNTPEFQTSHVATEAARYPVLYYAYESTLEKPFISSDILTRLFVLRLGGVLLAFIMAYYVYRIGFLIFGKAVYARTLTLMVMIMPMFSFVSAGVNSDNLHTLLYTVVTYLCLKLLKNGINTVNLLAILFAIILDIYTKPQGILSILPFFIALILFIIKNRKYKLLLLLIISIMITIFIGWSEIKVYIGLLTRVNITGNSFLEFIKFSFNKLIAQNIVWFWGVFKWLGVVLPPIYWQLANRLVLVSIIGLFIYLIKFFKKRKLITTALNIIFLLINTIAYVISIYWYDWQTTKVIGYSIGIQARYFYPVIAPMFALMLTGLLSFVSKVKYRRMIRVGVVLFFIFLQIGGLFTILHSYYDLSSFDVLLKQLSQYKPFWAKGAWWYLWGFMYLISLGYLALRTIFARRSVKK